MIQYQRTNIIIIVITYLSLSLSLFLQMLTNRPLLPIPPPTLLPLTAVDEFANDGSGLASYNALQSSSPWTSSKIILKHDTNASRSNFEFACKSRLPFCVNNDKHVVSCTRDSGKTWRACVFLPTSTYSTCGNAIRCKLPLISTILTCPLWFGTRRGNSVCQVTYAGALPSLLPPPDASFCCCCSVVSSNRIQTRFGSQWTPCAIIRIPRPCSRAIVSAKILLGGIFFSAGWSGDGG
mmetsp:Transcript_18307/g.44203  ORF Transcript_18307/g.44203 Transcript_18307/m.44203 type:complete len:237 (+) Transcript_18307:199-909(+)